MFPSRRMPMAPLVTLPECFATYERPPWSLELFQRLQGPFLCSGGLLGYGHRPVDLQGRPALAAFYLDLHNTPGVSARSQRCAFPAHAVIQGQRGAYYVAGAPAIGRNTVQVPGMLRVKAGVYGAHQTSPSARTAAPVAGTQRLHRQGGNAAVMSGSNTSCVHQRTPNALAWWPSCPSGRVQSWRRAVSNPGRICWHSRRGTASLAGHLAPSALMWTPSCPAPRMHALNVAEYPGRTAPQVSLLCSIGDPPLITQAPG